jgi:hypothetical protein
MNKKKLTNEELDAIGRDLVRASAVPEIEIERIVAAPMLFNSIKRRIEADRPVHEKEPFLQKWAVFPLWNWHKSAVAFATAIIFLAGTVAVFVFAKRSNISDAVASGPSATSQPRSVVPTNIPRSLPADGPSAGPQLTSYKKEPVRQPRVQPKRVVAVREIAPPTFEAEGDFYPVSYAGSQEEMTQGGQIVRTEIPRSSLFAMGVDVPVEGPNEKIKTDLLVGPDGVVRGVRIVK